MRYKFKSVIYDYMRNDPSIYFITPDLGYGFLDKIFLDFPDRTIKCKATEQLAMGIAVGLAQDNKIPVVYSITPFLLWRAAEWIRNYLNHEQCPVKLLGGGRDNDYSHDGFTHYAGDDKDVLKCFSNIKCYWPKTEDELNDTIKEWLYNQSPSYLNLKR